MRVKCKVVCMPNWRPRSHGILLLCKKEGQNQLASSCCQPERKDLQVSICTVVYFSANDFTIFLIFEDMMMILN